MSDTPDNGWWPDESPVTQMFFKEGKQIGQVIRQTGNLWRPFSLIEMNKTKTTGLPLSDSVPTKDEAKKLVEEYAKDK